MLNEDKVRIVGLMRPMEYRQKLYVYKGSEKLGESNPKEIEVIDDIFSLVHEYGVGQIDLAGPKQYNRGLKRKIENVELGKYNKNFLEINII